MTITALFFASYRELAGVGELQVELPMGATVADLIAHVSEARPSLAALPSTVAVAVNRQYSAPGPVVVRSRRSRFYPACSRRLSA